MAYYKLYCIGASGNSYKLALYLNCAGLDWEPVGVDFAGGQTRDANWRADTNLSYAVKYLAGAYRAANSAHKRAMHYYASGYYHAAKRHRHQPPPRLEELTSANAQQVAKP